MTIRIAAIEGSHWHAVYDAAYLHHLIAMPDVKLVAIQDSKADVAAKRAAAVRNPPIFMDYRKMLATTHPAFVVALGRHRQMAGIAYDLLDQGYPFLMEKPMGINAAEIEAVAENAMSALPLKADISQHCLDVRFGPKADISQCNHANSRSTATREPGDRRRS